MQPRRHEDTKNLLYKKVFFVPSLPQKDVQIGEIPRFDSITRTNTVAAATYSYNNGWRAHAQASLTYYAGPHNLKLGWQMYQTRSVGGGWSVYTPEGYGLRAVFRNGYRIR
jgi:hypothetical protein